MPAVDAQGSAHTPTSGKNATTSQTPGEAARSLPHKERRKSREGSKRMGGGKKGLWGKPEDLIVTPAVDVGDPNYDSEKDENIVLIPANGTSIEKIHALSDEELKIMFPFVPEDIKKDICELVEEYFSSGESEAAAEAITILDTKIYHYEIVRRLITISMDRHGKEREMVSRLLSDLYPAIFSLSDIVQGFKKILVMVNDLELDIPDTKSIVATFIARAIVDDVLPPKFLDEDFVKTYGSSIADLAIKKLSVTHGAARMGKGWGPGDGRPVEELKVVIDQLSHEFLLSKDLKEASRCVKELNVRHFHHEVIKRCIVNSLDKGSAACESTSALLKYLVAQDVISSDQLVKGFNKVKKVLEDIEIDVPGAKQLVADFIKRGKADGILPSDYEVLKQEQ